MRIRTVKPEFWKNEHLCRLPEKTRLVALALLNYADDEGYFNANPELFKGECFPFDKTSLSVQGALTELSNIDYIRLSEAGDTRLYGFVVNFDKHQRINRASPSKIKGLASFSEDSVRGQRVLIEDSLLEHGTGNKEQGTGKGGSLPGGKPPADDKAWLEDLCKDAAYQGIDVMREYHKALRWCATKKLKLSRQRLVNWLNKADRPMSTTPSGGTDAIDHAKGFFHRLDADDSARKTATN